MDRFNKSISWNQPRESGPPESESSQTDEPVECPSAPWEANYDSNQFSTPDDGDSGDDTFVLEDSCWAQLTGHRSFFLPLHYVETYEYPLIVWLHSNGYNENQVDMYCRTLACGTMLA